MWRVSDVAIVQIATLIMTVVALIHGVYRDRQTRRWAVEDRRKALEEALERSRVDAEIVIQQAQAAAEALRITTESAAEAARRERQVTAERLSRKADQLMTKVEQVHKVAVENIVVATKASEEARAAYVEANNLNLKMANIHAENKEILKSVATPVVVPIAAPSDVVTAITQNTEATEANTEALKKPEPTP